MINQQLVLPGISLDELKPIEDPKFTYGVEIEAIKFNAGNPFRADSTTFIENISSGVCYVAGLKGIRTREQNGWSQKDFTLEVSRVSEVATERKFGCKFKSEDYFRLPEKVRTEWESKVMPRVYLQPDGNLPPGWKEVPGSRYWLAGQLNLKGSSLYQAREFLDSNDLKDWKALQEGSVTDFEFDGIELTSPVFKYGEENSIEKVCNLFQSKVETDLSCGLHIHVGIENQDFTLEQLKLLVTRWIQSEQTLLSLPFYKKGDRKNWPLFQYAKMAEAVRAENRWDLMEAACSERNAHLNLHSLYKYNTLEFRGFESTLDPDRIQMLVQFCVEFIKEVLC